MEVFGENLELLSRMMTVSTRRHEVVSANIANINTPNYTARELRFEDEFQKAFRNQGPGSAMNVRPEVVDSDAPARADGNNVNLEGEFSIMQKNQLLYSVYAQMLKHKLSHLKHSISGLR